MEARRSDTPPKFLIPLNLLRWRTPKSGGRTTLNFKFHSEGATDARSRRVPAPAIAPRNGSFYGVCHAPRLFDTDFGSPAL